MNSTDKAIAISEWLHQTIRSKSEGLIFTCHEWRPKHPLEGSVDNFGQDDVGWFRVSHGATGGHWWRHSLLVQRFDVVRQTQNIAL